MKITTLESKAHKHSVPRCLSAASNETTRSAESPKEYLNLGNFLPLTLDLSMHRFFTFPNDYKSRSSISPLDFAEAGFYMSKDYSCLFCHFCDLKITSLNGWKNLNLSQMVQKHKIVTPNCELFIENSKNVAVGNPKNSTNYKFEAYRLYSLLQTDIWVNVCPYDLARSGFYYTRDADNCRCTFCNLEVRGWEKGDTAHGEHLKWNPNCPFLKNPASVGNIRIGEELQENTKSDSCASSSSSFASSASDLSKHGKHISVKSTTFGASSLGINNWTLPKYKDFSTMLSRLNSYKDWPKSLTQRPQQLASAGFFYTGTGDRVICFHCSLGLKDWDPKDSPSQQHAKWSATCQYLLMTKGTDFVQSTLYHNNVKKETDNMQVECDSVSKKDCLNCKKCEKSIVNVANMPCGHINLCSGCSVSETTCKQCNSDILASVNVFL